MLKLPDAVVVAGVTYPVSMKEDVIIDASTSYAGKCAYFPPLIQLKESLSDDRMLNTYLHELIHAMLFEVNLIELNDDEDFVCRFSKVLYQVVVDNQWNVGVSHVEAES